MQLLLTCPAVLHEELFQHDVPKFLVENLRALLDQSAVGFLQGVKLHILSAVKRNFFCIRDNPGVNIAQIALPAKNGRYTNFCISWNRCKATVLKNYANNARVSTFLKKNQKTDQADNLETLR